ncbi:MAG: TylF/MycF/NovP-related O-methyltransferase [Marmoricola sp.]
MPRSQTPLARRTVRRVLDALPARSGGGPDVEKLRNQLRRSRRNLKKSEAEVERLRREVRLTRASLRDPFPDTELSEHVTKVIADVRAESLTYLSQGNLGALASVAMEADRASRPGLIIEAGTALGGSAIVLAAAKSPERPMKVYDVFGMIPEPSESDGPDVHKRYEQIKGGGAKGVGGETYYGYRDDLLQEVTESFTRHGVPLAENNVELIKGLFQDTIDLDDPVAFAHLDGDWYDSTMVCLERIAPLLVPGGRIVLDDYHDWSGCRAAVDDYFSGRAGFRLERRAKVHVVRT